MKKLIAILLSLVCILGLVGCSQETTYQSTEIPNVSIRILNVSSSGATIIIKDTNDKPFVYGEWYKIEKESNGKWYEVKTIIDDYGFEDIGYLIEENSKNKEITLNVDWKWLYGELPTGQYRLLKQVDNKYISVEFDIV